MEAGASEVEEAMALTPAADPPMAHVWNLHIRNPRILEAVVVVCITVTAAVVAAAQYVCLWLAS